MRLLLIVNDVREIPDRGVILSPEVPVSEARPGPIRISLLRPDGTSLSAEAHVAVHARAPSPKQPAALVSLKGLTKADVPLNSEVWISLESDRPPAES